MTSLEYLTHSPEETVRVGEEFGVRHVRSGVVITLTGELGAGKTHFVKGIAGSLGIDERELTSPTYALANEYSAVTAGHRFSLYHLDCYRFEEPEELLELGVEDYLYPEHAATIVEWPERIAPLLKGRPVIAVSIEVLSPSDRLIRIALPQSVQLA